MGSLSDNYLAAVTSCLSGDCHSVIPPTGFRGLSLQAGRPPFKLTARHDDADGRSVSTTYDLLLDSLDDVNYTMNYIFLFDYPTVHTNFIATQEARVGAMTERSSGVDLLASA